MPLEAKGGNDVHVQFLGSDKCGPYSCHLHGVWDTSMILHAGTDREQYAQRLELLYLTLPPEGLIQFEAGTPEDWANESVKLAQAAWVKDGTNLDETYYQKQIKVVDQQMALARLRLAKLLNDTIGKMTPKDFPSEPKHVLSIN